MKHDKSYARSLRHVVLGLVLALPIAVSIQPSPCPAGAAPLAQPPGVDLGKLLPAGVWDGRDGIRMLAHHPEARTILVAVELGDHAKVRVAVRHDTPRGWTVNVGDSISNDGFSGDGASQSHDAEAQIVDGVLSVYGSDSAPANEKLLTQAKLGMAPGAWTVLEVGDGELAWSHVGEGAAGRVRSPHLYALQGQPDREGTPNRTVFVAVNRTVSGRSDRTGTGATDLAIWFPD